jgi:molybdate transport system permease protein
MVLIVLFGTPTAYLLASREFRGRTLLVTLVELPLVLPPAVAGIGLLAAFGRLGLLGGTMESLGIDIAFTKTAVVLAVTFVASPFYVRTAIAAFEAVDRDLVAASRTLGAGPARTFFRVALPLAAGGLGAGAALAFARGLGEFGATIMFAGSLQGVTQTLSLAIYQEFDVDFDTALAIGALLVVGSALVLFAAKVIPAWRRSTSASTTLFAPSASR